MQIQQLAKELGATLKARHPDDAVREVIRVMTLEDADEHSVSFITNPKYLDKLPTTRAAAVLADPRTLQMHADRFPCAVLELPNAYAAFAQAVGLLHPAPVFSGGVHPLAFVHPEAELGPGVTVMPLASVGKAKVGARTVIYPHVVVDDDVEIGADGLIHPHCVLMRGTRVGDRVVLQPGCILGSDGFGFAPNAQGHLNKIPQVGVVHVGHDVELGSNTTVDRAALGVTSIGDGTKIDNQVQIAHNVRIGRHVVIAGQSAIAGSATLEDHVMIGACSGVAGHLTVHKGARLAGASFTMRDIPAGQELSGIPAVPRMAWARQMVHAQNLDDHVTTLRRLEKRVAELEAAAASKG